MKKTYVVIHVDSGQSVEASFPDFPGLTVPGDRLADTILTASLVLQQHVEQLLGDGVSVPEPTTPDIWAIYDRHPESLIGFAEVETDQAVEEVAADEALDEEIRRDAQRGGYREEDAVEIVRTYRQERATSPSRKVQRAT